MHRRHFIQSMAAAGAGAAIGRRAHAVTQGWRRFEITYRINMSGSGAPVRCGCGFRYLRMRLIISG